MSVAQGPKGEPYPFEVWLSLLIQGWPAGQVSRVADRLIRIRGWKAGGTGPDRILYFYAASSVEEDFVRSSAARLLANEAIASPMISIFTRWRVDYRLNASPSQGDRLRLTQALRDEPRVNDAYFDHEEFRTISVLIEDEPSGDTIRRVRSVLAGYL